MPEVCSRARSLQRTSISNLKAEVDRKSPLCTYIRQSHLYTFPTAPMAACDGPVVHCSLAEAAGKSNRPTPWKRFLCPAQSPGEPLSHGCACPSRWFIWGLWHQLGYNPPRGWGWGMGVSVSLLFIDFLTTCDPGTLWTHCSCRSDLP